MKEKANSKSSQSCNLVERLTRKPRRRHVAAETDRLLRLKKTDPAAYRRLSRELREDAEEAERICKQLSSQRFELARPMPPKLRKLLERTPSLRKYSFPELWDIPQEVLAHVRIPRKRGPRRRKETVALIAKWVKLKQEGLGIGRIARQLYPDLPFARAKNRAKSLWRARRSEIEKKLVKIPAR